MVEVFFNLMKVPLFILELLLHDLVFLFHLVQDVLHFGLVLVLFFEKLVVLVFAIVVKLLQLIFIILNDLVHFLLSSGFFVVGFLLESFLFIIIELLQLCQLFLRLVVIFLDHLLNFSLFLVELSFKFLLSLHELVFLLLELRDFLGVKILHPVKCITFSKFSFRELLFEKGHLLFMFTVTDLLFKFELVVSLFELFDLVSVLLSILVVLVFHLLTFIHEVALHVIDFGLGLFSSNDTLAVV